MKGIGVMILSLFCFVLPIRNAIFFKIDVKDYLKRSADASSVEIAQIELSKAIKACEEKGYTDGYTSIFYRTPDEDVSFWYNNLVAANEDLKLAVAQKDSLSRLEESNVLMKLREVLTDNGDSGTKITVPRGLCHYPNNGLIAILFFSGTCLFFGGFLWLIIESD